MTARKKDDEGAIGSRDYLVHGQKKTIKQRGETNDVTCQLSTSTIQHNNQIIQWRGGRKMVVTTITGTDGKTLKGRRRRKDTTIWQEVYNHQPQDDALVD
jgi:hypothetical protein